LNTSDRENSEQPRQQFEEKITLKQQRKIQARREGEQSAWFGLGMFGLVGWSVAIPTLIGIALGVWIDKTWPSQYSWTLMLLVFGVVLGCINAWLWVQRESRED